MKPSVELSKVLIALRTVTERLERILTSSYNKLETDDYNVDVAALEFAQRILKKAGVK